MMKGLVLFLLLSLGLCACARNPAHIAFDNELYELDKRARAGEPGEIASEYHSMALNSYKASDRATLRFRAVDILIRAGDTEGAGTILSELKQLDLKAPFPGLIQLREVHVLDRINKNRTKALEGYTKVILENQTNLAARLALKDLRMMLVLEGEDEVWKQALLGLIERAKKPQLRILLSYHLAECHISDGQEDEALEIFEQIHQKHRGSLLWARTTKKLAGMYRARKIPKREVKALESLKGSLSKRGQLRLAELYCYDLQRPGDGIRRMRDFARRYPRSTLRDDAMWRLAECYGANKDRAAQKKTMCSILKDFPLTRNARRARRAMDMVIGPGLGGSGAENQGRQPCGPLPNPQDLARVEQP